MSLNLLATNSFACINVRYCSDNDCDRVALSPLILITQQAGLYRFHVQSLASSATFRFFFVQELCGAILHNGLAYLHAYV